MKNTTGNITSHYGRFKIVTVASGSTLYENQKPLAWGTIQLCKQTICESMPVLNDFINYIHALCFETAHEKAVELIEIWLSKFRNMTDNEKQKLGEIRVLCHQEGRGAEKDRAIDAFLTLFRLPF